jgi:hypothetical protein
MRRLSMHREDHWEEPVTNIAWLAYYYNGTETSAPPALTELIEAQCLDDAVKIAKTHMGMCKRVEIASPRWAEPESRVVLAREEPAGNAALH